MSARSIVRAHRRRLAVGVATAATAAAVAAPAHAADFQVLNNGDAGADTLRAQIIAANAAPGADRITFAPSVTGTITLASTLTVTDALTIQGPGSSALTVSGNGTQQILEVEPTLHPSGTRMPFTLSGLTLADGGGSQEGSAIYGTYLDLTINDAVITGNESGGYGGGLYFDSVRGAINNTQLINNLAGSAGGALYVDGDNDGLPADTFAVSGSTISGNEALKAGGAYFDNGTGGEVTIVRSTISNNEATGGIAGGILFYGHKGKSTIRQSTLSGNVADNDGGGIYFDSSTEVSYTADRSLLVENSTFTGNTSGGEGGAMSIDNSDAVPVTINNSTIAGNTAVTEAGGIFRQSYDVNLSNTIVAGNTAPTNPDLSDFLSATQAFNAGNSIIGNVGTADFVQNPAGSVQIGVDPQLGPLANNGGPTQTLLPATTSPAINKGVANGLTEDQRGLPRTSGGGTDIGAVELQPPAPPADNAVDGAKVSGKKTQKQKGKKVVIKVSAGAAEQVDLVASGQIKLGKKKFALKQVKKNVAAGATATLKLKPKKKSANGKILVEPKKAKVSVKVKFTDGAGNTTNKSLKVKLK